MATTPPRSNTGPHVHSHPHPHAHPHAHNLGPTYESTVVMDVGGDVGGLVFYTDPSHLGAEIDIFERGSDVPLTHTAVRERHLGGETYYAGVFPALPCGRYTLAPVGAHPTVDVTIDGGSIVEIHTEDHTEDHTGDR